MESPPPRDREPQGERIKVLLVGNDATTAAAVEECLGRMDGFHAEVVRGATLEKAKAALANEAFDVVLLDTRPLDGDGMQAAEAFAARDCEAALIFVIGGAEDVNAPPPGCPHFLHSAHLSPVVLESAISSSRHARQIERRLNDLYVDLERVTRSRADFFAKIGHDLKTPLNSIIGYSEAITAETLGPLGNPKYREYAQAVREAGAHLLELIDNLIHFSAGDMQTAAMTRCDLNGLAAAAMRMTDMLRQKRGHRLDKRLPANPVTVECQPSAITQAIVNLLTNAIKYSGKDGRIEVAVRETARHGEVAITDSGIGMSAADLSVALRPFGRVALPPEAAQEGTGLGLHIVREIMARHRGQLDISSAPGKGTTAILRLPRPPREPKKG